ncbi:kinesin family member 5 [Clonorchis sinensis]|uniref:Kinesin family member 5 n=1 Tax=Clonorchis sinensis TaxID=79923 RepID=H2KT14_CLOSI|nr:kinesin family member 5 [Clonorchis sinensis]
MCSLKRHRVSGPDDLPPALLKDGGEILSQRMSGRFADILENRTVSENWTPRVSELETKSTMVFGVRAKTIKNQVAPNAQLTAEEWRRLYERETDRTRQLFVALVTLDAEVRRWRNGETLSKDQWFTEDNFGKAYGELTCENADSLIHSSLGERATSIAMPLAQDTPTMETPPVSVTNPPKCPTRISAQITEPAEEMQSVEVFRLLDEKDDEINKQCQLVAKLENQLNQTREDYTRATRENDRLQTLLEKVQREADVRRTEVKDVLQALEELAVTYDEKNTQCKKVSKELEEMTTEIAKLKEKLEIHEADAEELKASSAVIKERLKELIYNLNVELSDLGSQLSKVFSHTPPDKSGAVEEQAAVLKLYVLQIKSELQTLIKHDDVRSTDEHSLQGPPLGSSTNLPKSSMDFGGFQRDVERKTKELMNLLKESEKTITRKQSQITQLEAELQMLNKELLQQRSAKQLLTELKQVGGMSEQIFSRFQYAMERTATHIQDQLAKAKGDAQCAHNEADKLKEENIILKVQLERFVTETELLQRRLEGLESGKNEPPIVLKEQAKTELKAMEDTVMHELEVLHSLRRTFITDLKNRVKKNVNKDTSVLDDEPIETQAVGSALQRERIAFLKTSLDNLTKVHKQLVRDNADLRCDIPKLEKRVKASMERIKDLEVALRESKEQMMRDKRRYHQEIERIKEANWARGNARVRINIVKPIRAGQQKDSG